MVSAKVFGGHQASQIKIGFGGQLEEAVHKANQFLSRFGPLVYAAEQAGVQPWTLASGGVLWLSGFLLWGWTGDVICTIVGSVYPIFASFKALDDQDEFQKTQWLVYWVTCASAMLLEGLVYRLICWIPFYHIFRLLFVIWLYFPLTLGAQVAYRWGLAPLFQIYRPRAEAALQWCSQELRCKLVDATDTDDIGGEEYTEPARLRRHIMFEECDADDKENFPVASQGINEQRASRGLGLQDLIGRELAKEAVVGVCQVAAASAHFAFEALSSGKGASQADSSQELSCSASEQAEALAPSGNNMMAPTPSMAPPSQSHSSAQLSAWPSSECFGSQGQGQILRQSARPSSALGGHPAALVARVGARSRGASPRPLCLPPLAGSQPSQQAIDHY
mmetsp:Transcript_55076/g.120472  ORF Transcript_55076/g.120472 Transcript_55076/m.120472 type:complete len:391 (-) Transcript_55076:537-1709(-)